MGGYTRHGWCDRLTTAPLTADGGYPGENIFRQDEALISKIGLVVSYEVEEDFRRLTRNSGIRPRRMGPKHDMSTNTAVGPEIASLLGGDHFDSEVEYQPYDATGDWTSDPLNW